MASKRKAIEDAIHGYCPHWTKWALMIEQHRANQPEFVYVREDATKELKKAVDKILKITRPKRPLTAREKGGKET